jgi:hypothetical protein
MSRESVLARGRLAAELGMVDACTIRRADAGGTDPDTGYPTGQTWTDLYAGKCRVQQAQAQAQTEDVGEDRLLLLRLEVQLPVVGTEGLQVGDEITMTAAAHDADLVGRVFLVHDLAHATEKTSRRVQCLEKTGS